MKYLNKVPDECKSCWCGGMRGKMKDIKFVLGECTKSNAKFYFQYNNKVYFIIEKTPSEEKVLDKITNIRYAYEKWRNIKAGSDDKRKKNGFDDQNTEDGKKDYSYTTVVFEYESQQKTEVKPEVKLQVKEKVEEYKSARKALRKSENEKKNRDERYREERKRSDYAYSEKKGYKRNTTRFDKQNSYRRKDRKGERQGH